MLLMPIRNIKKYIFLLIGKILAATQGPRVYSASNGNEFQKQRKNVSGE
jgi:hypothetical protein